MIFIKTIRITNFKSFDGYHEFTNLDRHFTAIVGPNGSGKSNIIDSILFVLGFRARKLRQQIQVDLIYKDTVRRDYCSVELTFCDPEKKSTFTVKRELLKTGKNKYFYNNEEVKSSVIAEILEKEQVDMENHRFLILQGEIESIAMMKPKDGGMLEYLEDVIGTTKFNEQIEAQKESIQDLKVEFETKGTAFAFYEKEFQFVMSKKSECEEVMKENLKYLDDCKKTKMIEVELLNREIERNKSTKDNKKEELEKVKLKIKESKKILEEKKDEMEKSKREMKKHEEIFVKKKNDFRNSEILQSDFEEKQRKYEKIVKKLEKEIKNQQELKMETKIEEEKIKKFLKIKNEELKNLEEKKNEIGKFLAGLEEKNKKGVAKIKKEVQNGENELRKLYEKKGKEAEKQVKMRKIREENARKKCLKDELIEKGRELEKVNHIDDSEAKKQFSMADSDLKQTWRELSRRKDELREIKRTEENNYGINKVNEALKGISGVFGRLSDLGNVDEKYERAISAAAKGGLNNLVVENTSVAEKCAEIIKREKFMRTTFLILDKTKEIPEMNHENFPYAFTLVNCEERFRKVFYFSLRDTLVVETMEEANRLAFGKIRKRVVTLDGKLIEKSGLMSSNRKSGGAFNKSKKLENIIFQLGQALSEFEKIKNEKQKKLSEIVENNEKVKNKERIKNEILQKLNSIEFEIEDTEIVDYEKPILEIKENLKRLQSEIENFYGKDYSESKREFENKENEIRKIENEIQSALMRQNEIGLMSDENKEKELEEAKNILLNLKPVDDFELRKKEIDLVEENYKKHFKVYEKWMDEVNKIKNKIGEDNYVESELKNKIEDIKDEISKQESKIKKNLKDEKLINDDLCILREHFKVEESEIKISDVIEDELRSRLKQLNSKLSNSNLKNVNMEIFKEFEKKKNEFESIKIDYESCKSNLTKNTAFLNELKLKRQDLFMEGFNTISGYLKEIYQTITFGGNAELELVDSLDPFTEGVMMSVMPPKKSWKNINNLSGGEKTISSLSLVFALHQYKPSPFYVMDEIDAALDFRNVSVIANYLSEKTKNAQFIVISLRSDMFELSKLLIGVYKLDDKSRGFVVDTNLI